MKKFFHYMETYQGQKVKNTVVCLGAAVVLLGALFKITHWPGATAMLVVGMLTEAALFAMFGVLPPHRDYHWEKFYPGLDIAPGGEHDLEGHDFEDGESGESVQGGSITDQLDQALEEADLGPELIENLGNNLSKLGQGLDTLGNLADVGAASEEFKDKAVGAASALERTGEQFSEKAMNVANSMESMSTAYENASSAVGSLGNTASEISGTYQNQMNALTNNVNALNEMYELELQSGNNAFKAIGDFRQNVNNVMTNLEASAEDTKQYREQVAQLAKNLTALNNVYGNMLSAMSASVPQNQ
jgi:gliding motility-associated protein GldL